MPYEIRKKGDKWEVVNEDSGKTMGTHETKKKARKQQKALYANEGS